MNSEQRSTLGHEALNLSLSAPAPATPGGLSGFAGGAGIPDDPPDCRSSMAVPVTRHATTPQIKSFEFLLCGIDTLDLGLYVSCGSDWKRRLQTLDKLKLQARKKGGLLLKLPSGRSCIFNACGKGENYSFNIQFLQGNLFISRSGHPRKDTPNFYFSISSQTLWLQGYRKALEWIAEDIRTICNGTIQMVKPSRVDLCADFYIPGGLDHEFLLSHKVTRNETEKIFLGKSKLETFYEADAKSPLQLRIYAKGQEIVKKGTKYWFGSLYGKEDFTDIWRVECQIRRAKLKEFGVDTLEDLERMQGGIWAYLTNKWFSLRIPDNDKAERRTVHPFWVAIQECAAKFGQVVEVQRIASPAGTASPEWHLSHIDGCLSSFAALLGITNRNEAIQSLKDHLDNYKSPEQFEEATRKKSIRLGMIEGGSK